MLPHFFKTYIQCDRDEAQEINAPSEHIIDSKENDEVKELFFIGTLRKNSRIVYEYKDSNRILQT